jgi:hypothetical protein
MTQLQQHRLLYTQAELPVFQNRMYDSAEQARQCPTGDVRLVQDLSTGLVYNQTFNSKLMVYDENYQNEQAISPLFLEHLNSVAAIISRYLGLQALVEVGCGKGTFLEMLLKSKFDITGFDPTYEGSNPRVLKQYFSENSNIQAKGLILRHVLEHIQDPYEFLLKLSAANSYQGNIYIEVPCFDWICKRRAWFDIFYEHVNYFRISDLSRLFGSVKSIGHLFGGQYIYIVGDLASLKPPIFNQSHAVAFPDEMASSLEQKAKESDSDTVIWGGASKGVIFALLRARAGKPVKAVIDINLQMLFCQI